MSVIILMMVVAARSMAVGEVTNKCEDILGRDFIERKEFARAVAHITHSLYLEPLRLVLYIFTS
jgi:hypothetical protein